MKIGIDCRLWNESGVGRYIRNLVKELQILDKKNNYTLFVLSKDFEHIKYQISRIKNNLKFEIARPPASSLAGEVGRGNWKLIVVDIRWHTLEEQLRFHVILNKENLDLVHFPYISVPIFYNKPFVVTIHDLIPYHYPTGEASTLFLPLYELKLLGYRLVVSAAAKKAQKIITVSNATKEEIIDHLGVDGEKVMVIYEGVDNKIRNSNIEIRNNFRNTKYEILNTKYFLYVGNAYPHKNLNRLIQALNILISQYLNISLVFVGKEDHFYKKLKEKTKQMGLEKLIIFLGEVSDGKLRDLYKNAAALVMPSLMEGFGLPALEAMANRCLVLASNISALKEVCGDAAIYFDPYSIDDIRKSMEVVCFNDLNHFSKNIKNGLERAKIFSWEKMAQETLRVYNSLMISNKF